VSVLRLAHVSVLDRAGEERLLLNDVCLELDAGELIGIWGRRRSGRTTLLRVAAGLQTPHSGEVLLSGEQLRGPAANGRGIAFCGQHFRGGDAWSVEREIVEVQLARGASRSQARTRTRTALERTGATHCAERRIRSLPGADAMRARLALALTSAPRLLLIDDVIAGVDLAARDPILRLLRSLADEGVAILTSTDETPALAGCDRALTLCDGRLEGRRTPDLAEVVPLRRSASA
jgi:ABC-type multidrug transport system ATPase subunit